MIQIKVKNQKIRRKKWLVSAILLILICSDLVSGADIVKDNNTSALNITTSWVGGAIPASSDVAIWNSTVAGANSVSMGADATWLGLKSINPGGAVTISDNTLTLGLSGIDMSSATQNLTIASALTLGANQSWDIASGRTLSVSGVVSGSYTLTKSGAGTVVLSGDNTFGLTSLISEGVANIRHSNALGSTSNGTTISSGAALEIQGTLNIYESLNINGTGISGGGAIRNISGASHLSGSIYLASNSSIGNDDISSHFYINFYSGSISGTGTLTKIGLGSVIIYGNNSYTNITTISEGSIWFSNNSALGTTAGNTIIDSGGSLVLWAGITCAEPLVINGSGCYGTGAICSYYSNENHITGTINLASASSIGNAGDGDFYIDGVISNSGNLTKVGTGPIILRGNNTYTGTTTISSGELWICRGNALGNSSSGTTVLSGGSILLFDTISISESITLNGHGDGSGSLINFSENNIISGNIILNNASTIGITSDMLTISGAITGSNSLTKQGAGILTLSGSNTYTGATSISGGTLQITGTTDASSTITVANATTLSGTGSIGGSVVISAGGIIAPGSLASATGKLSTGSVTMAATSVLNIDVGTKSDTLYITGDLTLDGTVNIDSMVGFSDGTYTIASYSSTLTDNTLAIGTTPNNDYNYQISASSGKVDLIVSIPNQTPTDIALSDSILLHGDASGQPVGLFSTTDEDVAQTHTYSLVAGTGDTDNGSFTISGNVLKSAFVVDCATKSSYTVRVKTSDNGTPIETYEEAFTISSGDGIYQDLTATLKCYTKDGGYGNYGKIGGNLRGASDTYSWETTFYNDFTEYVDYPVVRVKFLADISHVDSWSVGNDATLYEQNRTTYTGTNSWNDFGGNVAWGNDTLAKMRCMFNGTVTMTSLGLTNLIQDWFSGTKTNNAVTLSPFSDFGSWNAYCNIDSGKYRLYYLNHLPTDISLSDSLVLENRPTQKFIGTFSTTDIDTSQSFTYSLVAGTGDTDNGSFSISNDTLYSNAVYDFETKATYTIRVKTNDGTCLGSYEEAFTISVLDAAEKSLLPLTIKHNIGSGVSDTILVYTDNFSIVFYETSGGGIKFLSDSSDKIGTNQASSSGNLFSIAFNGVHTYNQTGVLSLYESNSLFVKIGQRVTLSNLEFKTIYTVYGNGTINIAVSTHNRTGSSQTGEFHFYTTRLVSGTSNRITSTTTASTADFILNADNGVDQFDILFSPFSLWDDATGFYSSENTSAYLGYTQSSNSVNNGEFRAWNFLLDFGNDNWDDTTNQIHYYADGYQNQDSISFSKGTFRFEKAWEEYLLAHWSFDEKSSGASDEDTTYDLSGGSTLHNAKFEGGTWDVGKWGNGAMILGGSDTAMITNASDFTEQPAFTIFAWIKKSGTSETNALIFGEDGATTSGFRVVSNSDKLTLYYSGQTFVAPTSLGTDWRFIAVSVDYYGDKKVTLFVDGAVDTILYLDASNYSTGSNLVSIGNGFSGTIDDLRFYRKIISNETVLAIYNNGYRPSDGMFQLRADNNATVDFNIGESSTLTIANPIFQIANYYPSTEPVAVYYDGLQMSTDGDYICYLDDDANFLFIGFNMDVRSENIRIYIDDTDSLGVLETGPTKKMAWGTNGSDFYVQNFSGATFSEHDDEYYIYYAMPSANTVNGGEISQFKSSAINPSTAITSADNLVNSNSTNVTFGYYEHEIGSASWNETTLDITTKPTYTVLESSDVRVRFQVDVRTSLNNTSYSYDIKTIWTIYPTGQIFRYDSIANLTHDITTPVFKVAQRYGAGITSYCVDNGYYGGIHGGSTVHDFSMALISGYSNGVADNFYMGFADTVKFLESATGASDYTTLRFRGATDKLTTEEPFRLAYYFDIAHQNMSNAYIDSVAMAVRNVNYTDSDVSIGTRITNSWGDLNGDGYNETEGTYTIQASNNTIDFTIQADAATDRPKFYPAIKITNYFAAQKPKYVHLYGALDTTTLLEGYGYNCYLDTDNDYLVIQLDTVLCTDAKCYISDDDDLAVTLSEFYAKPGNAIDTIFWRTESELENAGFDLYRRIDPLFYDSIDAISYQRNNNDECGACELFEDVIVMSYDTIWNRVNSTIIPGVIGGASYGPVDYLFVDDDVHNYIKYEYLLESIDFNNYREKFGPIDVIPMPTIINEKDIADIQFIAVPNPAKYSDRTIDFYCISQSGGLFTLYVYDPVGNLLFTDEGTVLLTKQKQAYISKWNITNLLRNGRIVSTGTYLAVLKFYGKNGLSQIRKLFIAIKR